MFLILKKIFQLIQKKTEKYLWIEPFLSRHYIKAEAHQYIVGQFLNLQSRIFQSYNLLNKDS